MKQALLAAFALLAATSASALESGTIAFLTRNGYNPNSPEITAIADDVVQAKDGTEYSLDYLAGEGDKIGTRAFITTRNFVKKYMQDTKTPFPTDKKQYQTLFLKPDEVSFILTALRKPFSLA